MSGFSALRSPPGRYWADPFLFQHEGRRYIFHEEYRYHQGKGVISVIEVHSDGSFSPSVPVLARSYHLSYPGVFQWGNDVYMIPETRQNRTVELYRADDFPTSWQLVRALFEGVQAVDPTLFAHDGKLWLFTSMAAGGGSTCEKLFLFHGHSLTGPWTSHPQNPIVDDLGSARPAGRLFWRGGQLLRPSQDCTRGYGRGLVFNLVEVINEKEYRESRITRVDPSWLPGNVATHTYAQDEGYEAVDGMLYVDLGALATWATGGVRVLGRTARNLLRWAGRASRSCELQTPA